MADSFNDAVALTRLAADEHSWVVPDGWQQGRGAFGGVVLGAALSAIAGDEPDAARAPRAFLGEICAPVVPGPTRVKTRALRRGKHQSNIACTLIQSGEVVAHASAVLAGARSVRDPPSPCSVPPDTGRFEDAPILSMGPPIGPVFATHYEFRLVSGAPHGGASDAVVAGWVRESVPLGMLTYAALLARLDSFWPAFFAVDRVRRPMATVSFMAEFLADPATLDPTVPMFYRARAVAQAGGYCVELRELWRGSEPVAFNQQSFALLA